MLLQHRQDAIHLISQNDHALVSGEMARRWRGLSRSDESPNIEAVVAIALHDAAWIEVDEALPLDSKTGLPHDFQSLPSTKKIALYTVGLDGLERTQPYAALLVSLHYGSFVAEQDHAAFHLGERQRRQRLRARLDNLDEATVSRDLALLRLLDVLSLRLCLTAPRTLEAFWPRWVMTPVAWDGVELSMAWRADDVFVVKPFPFHQSFEVHIPLDRLPKGQAGASMGKGAVHGTWEVRIASA